MALLRSHAITKPQNNQNHASSVKNHPIVKHAKSVSHAKTSRSDVRSSNAIPASLLYLKVKRTRKFYAPISHAKLSSGTCKSDFPKARRTCLSNATFRQKRRLK